MIRRILLGGTLVFCPAAVLAQDSPSLVEYYGDGVHAYSSRDIFESHRLLTQAIDGGIQDPRAYYFRAMTLLRMGRAAEAEADMEAGAYLEAHAPSGAYAVDRSIQRLQGRDRLALEKVRRRVRFEVEQKRRTEIKERYEQTQRNEAEVLRIEPRPTFDEAVQPAAGANDPTSGATSPGAPANDAAPAVEATSPGQDTAPNIESPPADAPPAVEPAEVEPAEDASEGPFTTNGDPFTDTSDASHAAAVADPSIEVGQKIKGSKLLGILGSIFGDAVESAGDAVASAIPQPPMGLPFGAGEAQPGGDPFGGFTPPAAEGTAPPAAGNDPFGGADDPFGGLGQPAEPIPANENPPGADASAPVEGDDPADGNDSDAPSDATDPFGDAADPFN